MNAYDIINKRFSKAFRGYDMEEVDAFLDEIVVEFEKIKHDRDMMVVRIEALLDRIVELESKEKGIPDETAKNITPADDEAD